LDYLAEKDTESYVQKRVGANVIPVRWVFAVKTDVDEQIKRYKARLVAQVFHENERADFRRVYARLCTRTIRSAGFC
jgi:hypothetical protein